MALCCGVIGLAVVHMQATRDLTLPFAIIPQRQHSSIATQQQAVAMARSDGHVVEATGELGHLALAVAIITHCQHSALAAQQQRVVLSAGGGDEERVAGQVTLTVEVPTNTDSLAIVAQQHAVPPARCYGDVFQLVAAGLPEEIWHIALALAILSAAQYLSIACQCQRVAVSGGHCHDRAMSIFR